MQKIFNEKGKGKVFLFNHELNKDAGDTIQRVDNWNEIETIIK